MLHRQSRVRRQKAGGVIPDSFSQGTPSQIVLHFDRGSMGTKQVDTLLAAKHDCQVKSCVAMDILNEHGTALGLSLVM